MKFFLIVFIMLVAFVGQAPAQIPVMIYHAHPNFGYDEALFTEHMDFLADNGFHTITLDQFYEWHANAAPLPLRPIVLTVDDNYVRIYTSMYPIWAARGQFGVNFAHTDYVGVPGANDHADWIEINEMEASGHVQTESHTVTHANLTSIGDTQRVNEIVNSKAAIEANITSPTAKTCHYIAYPYGAYNATVIADCIAAGYRLGFATTTGLNYRSTAPFELHRQPADGVALSTFIDRIGYHDLPPAPPGDGWILDNTDPHCFYDAAKWTLSTSPTGFFHINTLVRSTANAPDAARWAAYLPESGLMNVYARWPENSALASNAAYTITHAGGSTVFTVDQGANGGAWNLLGSFTFAPGAPVEVTLGGEADGDLAADAIWFEPLTPSGITGWQVF